jgi:diguanylate cyclase (GGDEF)-like protein
VIIAPPVQRPAMGGTSPTTQLASAAEGAATTEGPVGTVHGGEVRVRQDRARILIVEDSGIMRSMLTKILAKIGYENVLAADSGTSAINLLGLGDEQPGETVDLILMDLILPDIEGIEVIRAISAREELQKVPIIAVTGMQETSFLKAAFEAGATDFITKPVNDVELQARMGSALRLKRAIDQREERERQLVQARHELELANQRLEQLSLTDGLTGVANRRHFDQAVLAEWDRAARDQESLTLLLMDIDHFKRYNDTYGHQDGDQCLQRVASALAQCATRPGDLVARYGGEEFAVVLPNTDLAGAQIVGERLRAEVAALAIPHSASSVAATVTLSIGVATLVPSPGTDVQALIAAADQALYQAKGQGRNRVVTAAE